MLQLFKKQRLLTQNWFQKQGTLYKFYIKIISESFVYISFVYISFVSFIFESSTVKSIFISTLEHHLELLGY